MFKKIVKGIAIGTAALTLAATAQAAEVNLNLYGASAQFTFWTAAAPNFLVSQGCQATDVYSTIGNLEDRDAGIAVCAGTVVPAGSGALVAGSGFNNDGNTYYLRYTTRASVDGIRAVTNDPAYNPDGCTNDGDRRQADALGASFANGSVGNGIATLSCQDVTIGASDVAAATFGQITAGHEFGPNGGDVVTEHAVYPTDLMDPETMDFQVDRPIVVPFGFFANYDSAVEGTPGPNAVPFDNMTRLMAVSIFSGQVANWKEFTDDTSVDLPMVVCMRHAGSGTLATLDAAVMRGDAGLVGTEIPTEDFGVQMGWGPAVYFNLGSSDAMKCVKALNGAVGYADADKCVTNCATKYKAKPMTYQGVAANSETIRKGLYDFWSAQWLYSDASGDVDALVDALAAFASDEVNLPATKSAFWASQNAMKWEKGTDFAYPTVKPRF
ncbi:MAG: substrate-binding domain-containing protein [Pseudomonadota bacterium]